MIRNTRTTPLSSAALSSLAQTHNAQKLFSLFFKKKKKYSFLLQIQYVHIVSFPLTIHLYIRHCVLYIHIYAQYLLQNKHVQTFCPYTMNLSNISVSDSILVIFHCRHKLNR